MEFDAFTIVAQIFNFAFLVFILKRFLYRPLLDAMDGREATIVERLADAEEVKAAAERKEASYKERLEALDAARDQEFEALRADIDAESLRMHRELRERVDTLEDQWRESLKREGGRQIEDFRDQLEKEVVQTVRRALEDLATRDLESQLIQSFLVRIQDLDDESVEHLIQAEGGRHLKVVTSFDVSEERRVEISNTLRTRFGDAARFEFDVDPTLIAGMELRFAGHRLGWSVDDYLDALERKMHTDLVQIAHGEIAADAIQERWDAGSTTP